ncbi:MAG: hypothetical protein HY698_05200 [Deltaproteobacteria bacterium]|nr:hypothetical protein [Deltaproteobacteria bacterium]
MDKKHVGPMRLALQGTRVLVLRGQPHVAGQVREVRTEPYLRTYVVLCDNGVIIYASGHELAREDDASRSPLALAPEY